jgi:hypothetical protein
VRPNVAPAPAALALDMVILAFVLLIVSGQLSFSVGSQRFGVGSMLSSADLSSMPEIESLRNKMQQMAALAAVFAVESGEPYFAFYPKWVSKQQMGAIKNGSGDELFAHFIPAGCFVKGFAHESEMSPYKKQPRQLWPNLLSAVPPEFRCSLNEAAFDIPATTFAIWRRTNDSAWSKDDIEYPNRYYADGSSDLLLPFTYTHMEFTEWLSEYFEVEVDVGIVEGVFHGQPLSGSQLKALNPSPSLHALHDAVRQTGYPLA